MNTKVTLSALLIIIPSLSSYPPKPFNQNRSSIYRRLSKIEKSIARQCNNPDTNALVDEPWELVYACNLQMLDAQLINKYNCSSHTALTHAYLNIAIMCLYLAGSLDSNETAIEVRKELYDAAREALTAGQTAYKHFRTQVFSENDTSKENTTGLWELLERVDKLLITLPAPQENAPQPNSLFLDFICKPFVGFFFDSPFDSENHFNNAWRTITLWSTGALNSTFVNMINTLQENAKIIQESQQIKADLEYNLRFYFENKRLRENLIKVGENFLNNMRPYVEDGKITQDTFEHCTHTLALEDQCLQFTPSAEDQKNIELLERVNQNINKTTQIGESTKNLLRDYVPEHYLTLLTQHAATTPEGKD